MTRFDAFEVYLKPPKQEGDTDGRSFRQKQFDHWLEGGWYSDWLACERRWQERFPVKENK